MSNNTIKKPEKISQLTTKRLVLRELYELDWQAVHEYAAETARALLAFGFN